MMMIMWIMTTIQTDYIDDCESHLQDFDVVVSNFKERVRAR